MAGKNKTYTSNIRCLTTRKLKNEKDITEDFAINFKKETPTVHKGGPRVCKLHEKTNFKKELVCMFTKSGLKEALRLSNFSLLSGEDEINIQWIINAGEVFHDALIHI